jgi:hypothetical protein
MADGTEKNDEVVSTEREEIFSKSVRAGKRTYFFDVKTTRRNDYYLTLTESKKRFNRDGRFYFEKHKIFLYKEDFDKFTEGLAEVIEYIRANAPEILDPEEPVSEKAESTETKAQVTDTKETGDKEVPEEVSSTTETEPKDDTQNDIEEKSSILEEEGEPITQDFSNLEFEDLEDKKDS